MAWHGERSVIVHWVILSAMASLITLPAVPVAFAVSHGILDAFTDAGMGVALAWLIGLAGVAYGVRRVRP
jgi:hypothetical protein